MGCPGPRRAAAASGSGRSCFWRFLYSIRKGWKNRRRFRRSSAPPALSMKGSGSSYTTIALRRCTPQKIPCSPAAASRTFRIDRTPGQQGVQHRGAMGETPRLHPHTPSRPGHPVPAGRRPCLHRRHRKPRGLPVVRPRARIRQPDILAVQERPQRQPAPSRDRCRPDKHKGRERPRKRHVRGRRCL